MSEAPDEADISVEEPILQAPQEPAQADPAPSAEDRALTMGWTPREQFKGDPAKWVDAETFVRRGEEFLPFVKANNKRLERELEKANGEIAKLGKAVERSIDHISKAEQRAYERARKDLEAELEQAVLNNDADGIRAVAKDIVELEREVAKPAKTEEPDLSEFKAANPWFETDEAMTMAAVAYAGKLASQGVAGKDQLAKVSEWVRKEFPHKFSNPRREQPAAVEGVSTGARRQAASYSDMPADARQMCDELVRDKIITREKYVAEFFKQSKT